MFKHSSIETDLALDPKVTFLNCVFLFAGIVAFGMGFIRWQASAIMGAIDFVFALCAFALVYYLNSHKERVEAISSIALVLAYGLFTAIYLLAPYNTTRISLFFLLSASAFFLKGRQAGIIWLILILLTIVIGHFLPGFDTSYSHIDIVTASLYLLALFFIFLNYEKFKEKVNERDRDKEVLRLSEERFRTMVENGNDIISIISDTGKVRFISSSVEPVLGFEPGEMINKHVNDLIHPDEQLKAATALANALAHPGGKTLERYEFRMKHKDGSYRDIEMVGRYLIGNPVIGGIVLNGRDITERRRAEETLRESEARFHALSDLAGDLIFTVDAGGKIIYVNEMAARALHTVPEQVVGKRLSDFFQPVFFEQQWRNLQKVFETGVPLYVEEPICFPHGEVWQSTWLTPLRDTSGSVVAVLGASREITERKLAESKLESAYREIEKTQDASLNIMADLGREVEERKLAKSKLESAYQELEKTQDASLSIMADLGREVEQRKRVEAEVLQLNAELEQKVIARTAALEQARLEVEQASRGKDEFLAAISHELKTPLNHILGFADLLKEGLVGELSAEQKEMAQDIFDAGNRELAIVNSLIELARLQVGKVKLQAEPQDPAKLLAEIATRYAAKAEASGLAFAVELAQGLGEMPLDREVVTHVLDQLLANAFKFTPSGGKISLTARRVPHTDVAAPVRIEAGEYLELAVVDNGPGIAPDIMPRLFQSFVQGDGRLNRSHGGTGVGLVLVRLLAELHGGGSGVESEPGNGTKFLVWLPCDSISAPKVNLQEPASVDRFLDGY